MKLKPAPFANQINDQHSDLPSLVRVCELMSVRAARSDKLQTLVFVFEDESALKVRRTGHDTWETEPFATERAAYEADQIPGRTAT